MADLASAIINMVNQSLTEERDPEKDKWTKIAQALSIKPPVSAAPTGHPAGSHPVGAFLDRLFAHDRPTFDTGQEGFASSVGGTLGDMIRENGLRLKSAQSSPMSVMENPAFQQKASRLDETLAAQNQQASISPVSGLNMTVGGVENRAFENLKLKNEQIRQSILPAVETGYVGQDAITGIMLEAKTPQQLKAYYLTKYPGVFNSENMKELDAAVKKRFPDSTEDKKSAGMVPSKKTKLSKDSYNFDIDGAKGYYSDEEIAAYLEEHPELRNQ